MLRFFYAGMDGAGVGAVTLFRQRHNVYRR